MPFICSFQDLKTVFSVTVNFLFALIAFSKLCKFQTIKAQWPMLTHNSSVLLSS